MLFIGLFISMASLGFDQQKHDTLSEDYHRNVLKWNLTPFLLWGTDNINLSYERLVKP